MAEIEIRHYRLVSELSEHIDELRKADRNQNKLRFVVPSSKDRRWWRQRASLDQFGPCVDMSTSLQPWIWQDIYEDICHTQFVRPRRLISPPDRLLILRQILDDVLTAKEKQDKTLFQRWPGVKRVSFLTDLSSDVQELLNEAVTPEQLLTPESAISPETHDSPSDWLLPDVYSEYLDYLKQNELLDSAQIWTVACERLVGDPSSMDSINDADAIPDALDMINAFNSMADRDRGWGRGLTIVFTGFMSFTRGQMQLLMALNIVCKKIVLLKPEPFLNDFHDIDEQFENFEPYLENSHMRANLTSDKTGRIVELLSAEPALESEVVAREIALWSKGQSTLGGTSVLTQSETETDTMPFPGFENIGVSIAEKELESMTAALTRYGVPFTLENGPSVAETMSGRVLSSIRRLKTMDFPTRETAQIMTQPCFAGADFPTDSAIWANETGLDRWEDFLIRSLENSSTSANAKKNKALGIALTAIRAIKKFCEALEHGGTPAEIMAVFLEFLTAKGLWLDRVRELPPDIPELDDGIRMLSGTINAVEKKALALRELTPDLGPIGQKILKDDDAFEFLTTWCSKNALLPPLPRTGSLHLCIGTPAVLASWPVWFMLDVTQKTWQSPIIESPLLNHTVRERIAENNARLPSIRDKVQQRMALFRRLLLTGESLTVVSRAKSDEKGRELPETSYVKEFVQDIRTYFRQTQVQKDPETLDATDINFLIGNSTARFVDVDPDPQHESDREPPKITKNKGTSSYDYLAVSELTYFLTCPFRWWLKNQAKLKERADGLFQRWQQGTIMHILFQETWQRFYGEHKQDINADNFDFTIFSHILDSEWERMVSQADGPYAQFSRFMKDLRFKRRLDIIHSGVQRLGTVQANILKAIHDKGWHHDNIFLEDEGQLECEVNGVKFSGQCDRIEILSRDSQRMAFISDYKLGTSTSYDASIGEIRFTDANGRSFAKEIQYGLQLSAYALMFSQSHKDISLAGVGFLGIKDGKMAGTFKPELGLDDPNLEGCIVPTKTKKRKKGASDPSDILENTSVIADLEPIAARELEAEFAMQCAAEILKKGEFLPFYSLPSYKKDSAQERHVCGSCKLKGICRKEEFRRSLTDYDADLDENNVYGLDDVNFGED